MRVAFAVTVLLALGHFAAAQDTCPFKEADLSEVNWATAKKACGAPEATFCASCICGLRGSILDGLAKKGITVPAAEQPKLIENCMSALLNPLTDPKVGNMGDEVGKVSSCPDIAATAAKCGPVLPTTKPAPKPKPGTSPLPAEVTPEALPSPGVTPTVPAASPAAVPSPPPKSSAGAATATLLALAAAGLLQALLV